jgi:hypothetical protein
MVDSAKMFVAEIRTIATIDIENGISYWAFPRTSPRRLPPSLVRLLALVKRPISWWSRLCMFGLLAFLTLVHISWLAALSKVGPERRCACNRNGAARALLTHQVAQSVAAVAATNALVE